MSANSEGSAETLGALNDTTTPVMVVGWFMFIIRGISANLTVVLEVSFDGGVTWVAKNRTFGAWVGSITLGATTDGSLAAFNPEFGVLTRARVSAYTSGSAEVRIDGPFP